MRAAMPLVHEVRTPGGFDADGYPVSESWAPGVDRQMFGYEPEHLDVEVSFGYQMRVTNRIQVMVPDVHMYKPNDHLVLHRTAETVTADDERMRVDEVRDYGHGPFHTKVFGPHPGVLVVESIRG